MRTVTLPLLAVLGLCSLNTARAADLDYDYLRGAEYEPVPVVQTESFAAELFVGYVAGQAREYVNVVGGHGRLSQLNWDTNSLAVGGRVAFSPFDGVTFRGRGWTSVFSGGTMEDYDWLNGYNGASSWTHYSQSPNAKPSTMWQADASAAVTFYSDEDTAFYGIGGYRYFTFKSNARGGSFIYSSLPAYRDLQGMFPGGQLGVAYQQEWQTPYIGLGGKIAFGDWTASGELIGSPVAFGIAQDHHAMRGLVFKDAMSPSGMVGFDAALEYRVTPLFSVVGRAEYQNYLEAVGSEKIYAGGVLAAATPKPSVGASMETLLLSLGVKAKL
jgi:outer membrane protease